MPIRSLAVACGLVLIGLAGCRNANAPIPISGVVKLDGKPVPGAGLVFIPQAGENHRPATGTTDADGRYQLTSAKPGDGIPPGKYKVSISLQQTTMADGSPLPAPTPGQPPMLSGDPNRFKTVDIVPVRYNNPETSGLTADVSDAKTKFDFDLTTEPAAASTP